MLKICTSHERRVSYLQIDIFQTETEILIRPVFLTANSGPEPIFTFPNTPQYPWTRNTINLVAVTILMLFWQVSIFSLMKTRVKHFSTSCSSVPLAPRTLWQTNHTRMITNYKSPNVYQSHNIYQSSTLVMHIHTHVCMQKSPKHVQWVQARLIKSTSLLMKWPSAVQCMSLSLCFLILPRYHGWVPGRRSQI